MLTLIFDIGKTNKKYFLFDEDFNVVLQSETSFPEIYDDDKFLCDDIDLITQWLIDTYNFITSKYNISKINFSTYGASFVHLDKNNLPITPLYNYLKPLPKNTGNELLNHFENKLDFSLQTSSPFLGMLNSGLQLYWLKNSKTSIYSQIKTSLHFPQYCSFLFTKKLFSEFTSIGCHTGLWDYSKKDYHHWVKDEDIDKKLAPIVESTHIIRNKHTEIGVGIHDSSAALLPYLYGSGEKFVLLSTGTWSICLNPFNDEKLTEFELKNDCLNFMQPNGNPVKASRLFLGNEHQIQLQNLNKIYKKDSSHFIKIKFDMDTFCDLYRNQVKLFYFKSWENTDKTNSNFDQFPTFSKAYHQLIFELVNSQIKSLKMIIGNTKDISTVFIDGGFSKNELFCKMLALRLPNYRIKTTELGVGSALGAAVIMNLERFKPEIFNKVLKAKEIIA